MGAIFLVSLPVMVAGAAIYWWGTRRRRPVTARVGLGLALIPAAALALTVAVAVLAGSD